MAAIIGSPSIAPSASPLNVRQYDHLNQYYCPAVVKDGCAQRLCIRRKDQPAGFVGPASAFVECYDPDSDATSAPVTWNPVYDAATPPPGAAPAVDCSQVKRSVTATHCGWIWGLIILSILGILVFAGLSWFGKHPEVGAGAAAAAAAVGQKWSTDRERAGNRYGTAAGEPRRHCGFW